MCNVRKPTPDPGSAAESLSTSGARHRFSENILSNMVLFGAQILANLWMTPFLIGYLGVAAYGIIPLTQSIVSYTAVLTTSLDAAVGRFLTIDLGSHDQSGANKTFNTALFTLVGLIAVFAPFMVVLCIVFPDLFHVPAGWETDSTWLFATLGATFFLTVLTSVFVVSPFIHSKFLLINAINLLGILIRVSVLALSFWLFPPHLWYFGVGYVLAAVTCFCIYVSVCHRLTPELRVQPSAYDRSHMLRLVGMSGWLTVNTLGAMLLSRVDLIVVNAYFGAVILGSYAAVAQFSIFLDTLITSLCALLRPVLLIKYAKKDFEGLHIVANQSIKFLGLLFALIVGLLCGFSWPLLSIWLGPSFQTLSIVFIVLIGHWSVNLSVRPLVFVQQAYNRVRLPGVVTLLCGITNLGLAILMAEWGHWGYVGVAFSGALIWTLRNSIFTTIYTAKVMKLPWWAFLRNLPTGLAATILVGLASRTLSQVHMPRDWSELGLSAAIIGIPYVVIVWKVLLNHFERAVLIGLLPASISRGLGLAQ